MSDELVSEARALILKRIRLRVEAAAKRVKRKGRSLGDMASRLSQEELDLMHAFVEIDRLNALIAAMKEPK